MSRRRRCAKKRSVRARVASVKVLRRRVRAVGVARATTAATAAAVTLAGAGSAFATPSSRIGTVGEAAEAAGAAPVQCPAPRRPSSAPRALAAVGRTLFFAADDGIHGEELWKSDGTAAGTVLVKNINPTDFAYAGPRSLTAVGGRLFFTADDGTHGRELWMSDGSRAGTVLVKNINPGGSRVWPRSQVPDGRWGSVVLLLRRRHPRRGAVDVGWQPGGHGPGQEHRPRLRAIPRQRFPSTRPPSGVGRSSPPTTALTAGSYGSPMAAGRAPSWSRTSTQPTPGYTMSEIPPP